MTRLQANIRQALRELGPILTVQEIIQYLDFWSIDHNKKDVYRTLSKQNGKMWYRWGQGCYGLGEPR